MLEFLKMLFSSRRTASPGHDQRQVAVLLLTEVKLYNEKVVSRLVADPGSAGVLVPELRRAYEMYAQQTDRSAEAAEVFRQEAVRIVAGGEARLLDGVMPSILYGAPMLDAR